MYVKLESGGCIKIVNRIINCVGVCGEAITHTPNANPSQWLDNTLEIRQYKNGKNGEV